MRADETFEAQVTTYAGGCIKDDTTAVAIADGRADVVPYQRVHTPRAGEACTLELRITHRPVRLSFPSAGTTYVRVTGRPSPGDSLVVVERTVAVR